MKPKMAWLKCKGEDSGEEMRLERESDPGGPCVRA